MIKQLITTAIFSWGMTISYGQHAIIPKFKAGDFYGGVFEGIQEITKKLDLRVKTDAVNLQEVTVYQYIKLLEVDKEPAGLANMLTVSMQAPDNWVTEKDIPLLMTYINSTEPAKCVVHLLSSDLPAGKTATIGGHVMQIIEHFINRKDYPAFLTSCAETDNEMVEMIREWWGEQKK